MQENTSPLQFTCAGTVTACSDSYKHKP